MKTNNPDKPDASRRDALGALLWGSLAAVAAPTLYVACSFARPPRTTGSMAVVGPESELSDSSLARVVKVGLVDAIVLRDESGLYALNLRCTHSGCAVRWKGEENIFVCPCHGGRFDRHGAVLKGPPKEPLLKLPLTIENGVVSVSDQTMEPGR